MVENSCGGLLTIVWGYKHVLLLGKSSSSLNLEVSYFNKGWELNKLVLTDKKEYPVKFLGFWYHWYT